VPGNGATSPAWALAQAIKEVAVSKTDIHFVIVCILLLDLQVARN
jgi:hypothetical protein